MKQIDESQCFKIYIDAFFRTGRYFGSKVPSAGLMMMMVENFVPESLKSFFGVAKSATVTHGDHDHCEHQYQCSLVD